MFDTEKMDRWMQSMDGIRDYLLYPEPWKLLSVKIWLMELRVMIDDLQEQVDVQIKTIKLSESKSNE